MELSKIKIGLGDSAPVYDIKDTTYTFAGGTNKITVTPKDGEAYDVSITPSIANNVTGSSLTADTVVLGNGSSAVKTSSKTIATSVTNVDTTIPTSKAVVSYVASQISGALTSALTYKGSVSALPTTDLATGNVYVIGTAGTYDGQAMEVGDYLIYNGSGWDKINGENQVENKGANLATPGSSATIATVDGTNITVTTPSDWEVTDTNTTYKFTIGTTTNGDANGVSLGTLKSETAAANGTALSLVTTGEKAAWNAKTSNSGTVTKVSTGVGLTGGDITSSGTVKAKLKSETASTLDSAAMGSTASRQYAVGVDKSGYLSVNIPWTDTTVTSVANHYTATGASAGTKSASGATGSNGTTVQVVTGVTTDAAGHVTAVTSGAATDTVPMYSYDSTSETMTFYNFAQYSA